MGQPNGMLPIEPPGGSTRGSIPASEVQRKACTPGPVGLDFIEGYLAAAGVGTVVLSAVNPVTSAATSSGAPERRFTGSK